jgi:hypothetical protein
MEYADILERHRVLFGDPPFGGISVDRNDLRLQLEQEALGKLIKLRQGVLASGNEPARQRELLVASASPIMIIFRAFLRLHGEAPPTDNIALSEAVAQRAGFDPSAFVRVVRQIRGDMSLNTSEVADTLAGYLRGMQRLVSYLDTFGTVQ